MFTGKTVLITGATGGIGTETCLAFARQGAKLAVQSTSQAKLDALQETLGIPDDRFEGFLLDITDEQAVAGMVRGAVDTYGTVDILVNNAGKLGDMTPVTDIEASDFERIVKINLFGPFFVTKYMLRHMKERKSGTIVTVTSTAGLHPGALTTYTAAKHALVGFCKCAALQAIEYGVRMNAVAPGAVDTPMMTDCAGFAGMDGDKLAEFRSGIEAGIPDKRYATPAEVANTICFLASDASTHIIGQVITIDGAEYL